MIRHLDVDADNAVTSWALAHAQDAGPVTLLQHEILRKPELLKSMRRIESYLNGRSGLASRILHKGLYRNSFDGVLYHQWVLQSDWVDRRVSIYLLVRDPEKLTLDCEHRQDHCFPRTKLSTAYVDAFSTVAGGRRFAQLLANRLLLEREDLVVHADRDTGCTE